MQNTYTWGRHIEDKELTIVAGLNEESQLRPPPATPTVWKEGAGLAYTRRGLSGGRSRCRAYLQLPPQRRLPAPSPLSLRHQPVCGVLLKHVLPGSPPKWLCPPVSSPPQLAAPLCLGEEQQTCVLRCSPPSSPTSRYSQRKPKYSVCFLSWSQERFP